MIDLTRIRIDGGTQARAELNAETVSDYAEAYKSGVSMPPIVLFYDGSDYWLADGFHRYFGAKQAGLQQIYEQVIPGTQRDAVLYSLSANAKHGLRRTHADKRRAIATLLTDAEWSKWSDSQIAKACGVDHKTVGAYRESILGNSQDAQTTRTVERNGKVYEQNTANIGKAKQAAPATVRDEPDAGEEAEIFVPDDEDRADAIQILQEEIAELKEQVKTLETAVDPDILNSTLANF